MSCVLDKLEVKNLLHEKYHVDISDSMIQSERFPVYLSDVDKDLLPTNHQLLSGVLEMRLYSCGDYLLYQLWDECAEKHYLSVSCCQHCLIESQIEPF